jgi:aconitate hydratase
MARIGKDTLSTRETLNVGGSAYTICSLKKAAAKIGDISRLPYSLKILLENLLRCEDGVTVTVEDIQALADRVKEVRSAHEISFRAGRVLMQDFTGVPAVVDLAAMRDAMAAAGGDPELINPLVPVDLVIDHSVMVDASGTASAYEENVKREFERNRERYEFLKWGQGAFKNFSVVPPGTGICHQVNLEYLAKVVWAEEDEDHPGQKIAYPDTCVGTDSHTTMIGGLGVLGWGVGGIEAEAGMLGQPNSMLIPEVVGVRLKGALREGVTATDLVLTIVEALRKKGVVDKFVEFCGGGLDSLSLADRATIANMAPEYGATCGFFPVDAETLNYMRFTGRDVATVALVEAYAKAQGLFRESGAEEPIFTEVLEIDLSVVEASIAGPKRPQDRIPLSQAAQAANDLLGPEKATPVEGRGYALDHGHIAIAAITSCTNTSNPHAMVAAGLLARKARAYGLKVPAWVKTSLAPGSQVVTAYLDEAGLTEDLDALGFHLVGYGCTTCIGNSGPLDEALLAAAEGADLTLASVVSGNRNFEGRISPHIRANYLASPALVVAYAIAGSVRLDVSKDPIGKSPQGQPVFLRDVWPSTEEVKTAVEACLSPAMFREKYADVFKGPEEWQDVAVKAGKTYAWDAASTYIASPPYFADFSPEGGRAPGDIENARALVLAGDSVTTDHISPAGAIKKDSPAGSYLIDLGVTPTDFNSYGARRGNHEVMMRGTFANVRFKNLAVPGTEGSMARMAPSGEQTSVYDAAMRYAEQGVPLIVIAGKEYGTGSSRDWAAKGPALLGIRAAVAESFERIHRSNLIGMGVLPLEFADGPGTREALGLTGLESFTIRGISAGGLVKARLTLTVTYTDGQTKEVPLRSRIDTVAEEAYWKSGGVLHYVLARLAKVGAAAAA